eukprot:jgi/Chlat1/6640/Chrsp49S06145
MEVATAVAALEGEGAAAVKLLFSRGVATCQRALVLYGPERLAFSFNGGKDSIALLHLLRSADPERATQVRAIYFQTPNAFPQMEAFLQVTAKQYGLQLITIPPEEGFKGGLQKLTSGPDGIAAVLMGTRAGDPDGRGQGEWAPSSLGWPPFMRINPMLAWPYAAIWRLLKGCNLPYSSLYDEGYTSLGSTVDTRPNPALAIPDQPGKFLPAYMLRDSRLERAGRGRFSHLNGDIAASPIRHAAIIVVGDELLSGRIRDTNAPFLLDQLRAMGWGTRRVSMLSDDADLIAEEVARCSHECDLVITTGGVGPTHDDVTMAGIARAFSTTLARHVDLETSIKEYYKERCTDAHLQMANVPLGCTELIDVGGPFPVVQCRNVIVMPGVPPVVRAKWAQLCESSVIARLPPFVSVHLGLQLEEATAAPALAAVAKQFPDVGVGSYPSHSDSTTTEANLTITLEGKVPERVHSAADLLTIRLPEDAVRTRNTLPAENGPVI